MKIIIKNIWVIGIAVLFSCSAKLQTYDLSEEYATSLHYQPVEGEVDANAEKGKADLVGIPARSFYSGDLKRGAIWWAGKGITLEKGEVFIFTATNIGPDNTPFGATFPPIDLSKEELAIKITARSEGNVSDTLKLYLQLDDAEGYMANANRPFVKIDSSAEFQEYYFNLKDVFMQGEPKKHKVNGAMINSLKFFINPGQSAYTGKIFIKEVKVVPAKK